MPDDGRYYVLNEGTIHRSYRSLRDATAVYERLRAARLVAQQEEQPEPDVAASADATETEDR